MDEDFLTDGLQSDRYLKATKLVHRFESEVTEIINEVCKEIIDAHPELFDDDAALEEKVLGAEANQTLATNRTEFSMNFENAGGYTPKLNIALEWVKPEQQGKEDAYDGSLCYVMYKIQHGSETQFGNVKQRTESQDKWNELYFGEDQWYHYAKYAPESCTSLLKAGQRSLTVYGRSTSTSRKSTHLN